MAASLHALATLSRYQHNYERAESLYQRALHIREHNQPHHPDLATLFFDVAAFEHARGNDQAAVDLYQRALAIQKQALPAQHPAIVATEKAYAEVLQAIAFP
ncbi:MAG: tetratricopeptide repeat protein [Chloroflexota bacterium]|nr:tetratricopeptide repeat protein [Chloroflexota bacterium]